MKRLLFLVTISILFFSCNKNSTTGKAVEIYLLKTHQRVAGKCQVDAGTAVLQDTPIIRNHDIISYSKTAYTFEFTNTGFAKVKALIGREAFAVTVDKQVVYYGYYMPPILSSSCDQSITMSDLFSGPNKMTVNLGYPGITAGSTIDDQRNNPHLIATLSAQDKLR